MAFDAELAIFDAEDEDGRVAANGADFTLDSLPDRRAFEEEAARHAAFAKRNGHPLCFALIAFDGLGEVESRPRDSQRDELLREATSRWRTVLRAGDLLGRWGDDEFGIVLPNCNPVSAVQLCWRLREETPKGRSFSAGLASYQGSGTMDELIERADDCLDQAVAKGPDRTVAEGLVDLD